MYLSLPRLRNTNPFRMLVKVSKFCLQSLYVRIYATQNQQQTDITILALNSHNIYRSAPVKGKQEFEKPTYMYVHMYISVAD